MATPSENAGIADRFGAVAGRFCSIVDSASSLDRTTCVSQVYRVLPRLIDEAIGLGLQDVGPSENHEATRGTVRQRMEEAHFDSAIDCRNHRKGCPHSALYS
jgi:hypothetical protein